MTKKILITVGGTGGHIYPALALARQLKSKCSDWQLLFVGGGLTNNRFFDRTSFPHQNVDCGTLSLKKPLRSLKGLWKISKGIRQSYQIIKEYKPDVVVGFGSYHTLPTLCAAKLCSIPVILHEANRIPGRVNRLFSPFVDMTGVHFPDTAHLLKGKAIEMPIPLREGYQKNSCSKEDALQYFQLNLDRLTVLIFGGSQGAQSVNQLVFDSLIRLSKTTLSRIQILQFTGDSRTARELQESYDKLGISAVVKGFENRMDIAWQAADVMISRSGAVTIAEQLEFEVPGILIPYPHATDNHQEANANFVVDIVRGAVKCLEADLKSGQLAEILEDLLEKDGEPLAEMKYSMQCYKRYTRARTLCSEVQKYLN